MARRGQRLGDHEGTSLSSVSGEAIQAVFSALARRERRLGDHEVDSDMIKDACKHYALAV